MRWRTDPWLLRPSRLRLDPSQGLAFARATTAPALLVLARDGGFARTGRFVDPSSWIVRVGSALAARVRPGARRSGPGGAATLAALTRKAGDGRTVVTLPLEGTTST